MPIRIKPVYNFGPCNLTLENIQAICTLIDKEFGHSSYTAEDHIWIIYNEPSDSFLQAIDGRDKLDSFTIIAPTPSPKSDIKIEALSIENLIIGPDNTPNTSVDIQEEASNAQMSVSKTAKLFFNKDMAQIIFDIDPDDNYWLEHFLLDLEKHISPPTLLQRFNGFPIPLVLFPGAAVIPIELPYCRITLKSDQLNQRLLGIGDNIVSNMIYDILKLIIGVMIGIVGFWALG